MPNFIHRLFDPTYPGAVPLPALVNGINYDRVNVTDGGVGVGAAPGDGQKIGGVNPGTYWVSFSEDATSLNTNRGFRALAENSDTFDDLFNKDIALPALVPLVLGAPANTFTMPQDTYLGPTGSVLNITNLELLITITDQAGDEVMDVLTGTKVRVISVAGFPNSPFPPYLPAPAVVTLSANLNAGTYRVHFGKRSNLVLGAEDYYGFRFGQDHRTPVHVQNLFRVLRAPASLGHPWDLIPFTSTIYDLTLSGLNERYNRATAHDLTATIPAGSGLPTPIDNSIFNTPGAGSWYQRTGHAMSAWSQRELAGLGTIRLYQDPLDALWVAHLEDDSTGPSFGLVGGASGVVTYGARRTAIGGDFANDDGPQPGLAKFLGVTDRTQELSKGDAGLLSHFSPGSTVTFSIVAGPLVTLTLDAGDYFWRTVGLTKQSGIAVGYTMLEIEHNDPFSPGDIRRRTYIVRSLTFGNSSLCTVLRVDGGNPVVSSGMTGTLRRVLSTEFFIGDGVDEYRQAKGLPFGFLPKGFAFSQVPPGTNTPLNIAITAPVQCYASENLGTSAAMTWGGFNNIVGAATSPKYEAHGTLSSNGSIFGDGSILMQGNVVAATGSVTATLGDVVSGNNILAFGGVGPSGFVAGRGISQGIHILSTGNFFTAPALDPAIQGFTTFIQTTNVVSAFFAAIYINVPIGTVVDTDLWLTIWRSNPANVFVAWVPFMYSDNAVTPIPTYIDPADLILPPLVGPNGSVSVFQGRQVGNAVYWKVHGHYAVP